jgi:hypothetical protein
MSFGDRDLDAFFADFGVPVVYGAKTTFGNLKVTDVGNPMPDADNSSIGRLVELLIKTGAVGNLVPGTFMTVDGTVYAIQTWDAIEDGKVTRCYLQVAA